MIEPSFDIETFSPAGYAWDEAAGRYRGGGLPRVGAAVYAAHPEADILCARYDLCDGLGRRHWRPGLPVPADWAAHVLAGRTLAAWNAAFERWLYELIMVPRYGFPPMRPEQWRCTMARARAHALPGKLEVAGKVLATVNRKDPAGGRLLDKFSKPRNPTKDDPRHRVLPLWTPDDVTAACAASPGIRPIEVRDRIVPDHVDALALDHYNDLDVATEQEIGSRIPPMTPTELRYWQDDQRINHRGVRIDMAAVHDCIAVIEQATKRYGDELQSIAGCAPTEVKQLTEWLRGRGVHMESLDEEAVSAMLRAPGLPPEAKRALKIRAMLAAASVKKVYAMRDQATRESRLHDLYTFYGARTGRPTGNGPQPTNLPKAGPKVHRCGACGHYHGAHTLSCPWCYTFTLRGPKAGREWNPDAAEDALAAISTRSLDFVERAFGDAMLAIAGVLRGVFVPAPGHEFLSSDFTAIEGVVIACLAGEQWRIDAFAKDEPMYLLSAERMYGVPVAEMLAYQEQHGVHHPLRQKGKGGELGLGFGGWINALRQFDVDGPDNELMDTVLKWRAASPAIEWFWGGQTKGKADAIRQNAGRPVIRGWNDRLVPEYFGLEGNAVLAVLNPGKECPVLRLDGRPSGITYVAHGDALYCHCPGPGVITYHRPRLIQAAQEWRGLQLSFEGWNSNPKNGPVGWIRMNTYSGKVAENVTQHVARNKQMGAIARCEDNGYPIVLHTYDEVVAEVPEGAGSVEGLEALMTQEDDWNVGWPIKAAGGWRAKRYRKG